MSGVDLFSQVRFQLNLLQQGVDTLAPLIGLLVESDPQDPMTTLAVEYAVEHLHALRKSGVESKSWTLYGHMFLHRIQQNPAILPLATCLSLRFHHLSINEMFQQRSSLLPNIRSLILSPDYSDTLSKERNRMLKWLIKPTTAERFSSLEELELENWQLGVATTKQLLTSPMMSRLKGLNLSGNVIGIGGCKALAEAVSLQQLESLKLRGCSFDFKRLRALLGEKSFKQLRILDLSYNQLDMYIVDDFQNTDSLGSLEELTLSGNSLLPRDIEALCHTPTLQTLKTFELSSNTVGSIGVRGVANQLPNLQKFDAFGASLNNKACHELATGETVGELREVGLRQNLIEFEGLCSLLESPQLNRLKKLNLSRNYIAEGEPRVLKHQGLPELEVLDLSNNDIRKHSVEVLCQGRVWDKLETLDLRSNRLVVRDARVLFEEGQFPALRTLSLENNEIRNSALSYILNAQERFPRLRSLHLGSNQLTVKGMEQLANSPFLESLTSLALSFNKLGKEGIQLFLDSPYLTNLESLDLSGCDMGFHACRRFKKANLPNLKALYLRKNGLGEGSLRALAEAPFVHQLKTLDFRDNTIGYTSAQMLRKQFPNITDFAHGHSYFYYELDQYR